ncbi:GFA family protein [Amphritea opalescens]|uniref:GFA family protein n=1 Tax=Amphritea opalescens TaxID=2490544 RepID=A0A430KM45_9GAMM|nr:GFA family protein [Amphritea opalescens]RTE64548.1 GFA family protein [Amphritea opalescens]
MSPEFKGSCLCNRVAFVVNGFNEKAANCYCTMCQKFHGAAFGTLVGVSGLVWHSGFESIKHFTAPNGTTRSFCKECGSSLGFRVKNAPIEEIELAIALFNEDVPVVIDAQIYTNYRANWSQLQPDIPAFCDAR